MYRNTQEHPAILTLRKGLPHPEQRGESHQAGEMDEEQW